MATNAAEEREEELKSALWYSIGQYIDEETIEQNINTTPQFIGALTELVYSQIENTSRDLETFAKHAGRKQITMDDVMLLSRRNEGLETLLRQKMDEIIASDGRPPAVEKKAKGRPAKGKGKAKAKQ
ncbi:kinetochore component CENP-S-domain-containing protein [Clohesyomyces aquaticus]|uniref:Kinetochore component CENP-S-domain-containing protein n=1 Tax=Clohesyomyces aquaticus TaxID=1231657 RepID=A0A1Y1ZQ58_9PLEO|nr:kinetochore component CENP-S-domain-containing protein [Clohesyomyces aquaticus]